jgi:cell division protein FtsB
MTQHINLLRKQRVVPASLLWGALVVVFMVSAYTGYGLWLLRGNLQTQAIVRQQEAELVALRIQVAQTGQRSQNAEQLQQDIARLKPLASAYAGLLEQIRSGRLGLEGGYLDQLTILARTVEPNVWITQVTLGDAGRRFSLQGKALSEQSVLSYVDRLNQAYEAQGLALVTLDMTVDTTAPTAATAAQLLAPATKTISFRLN